MRMAPTTSVVRNETSPPFALRKRPFAPGTPTLVGTCTDQPETLARNTRVWPGAGEGAGELEHQPPRTPSTPSRTGAFSEISVALRGSSTGQLETDRQLGGANGR